MKVSLTISIQKEFVATSDEDADAKIKAIQQALEAQGWTVQIEDDSVVDEDDGRAETESSEEE